MVKEKKLLKDGIGESSAFYRCHPLLNVLYFAVIIAVTMFSNHPAFLLSSFVMGWVYSVLLYGLKAIKFNCIVLLPVILISVVLNALICA